MPGKRIADAVCPALTVAVLAGWIEGSLYLGPEASSLTLWGGTLEALAAAYVLLPFALLLGLVFLLARGRWLACARSRRRISLVLGLSCALVFPLHDVIGGGARGFLGTGLLLAGGLLLLRHRLPALPAWTAAATAGGGLLLPVLLSLLSGGVELPPPPELPAAAGPQPGPEAPAVLLVSVDTLRDDRVGARRDGRPLTPNLDRMAAEGRRLACTAPSNQTAPTHVSLLTGADLLRHGTDANGKAMPAALPALAELLRDAGWRTGAVVSNPVLRATSGFARGFEVYDDGLVRSDPRVVAFNRLRYRSGRWIRLMERPWLASPLLGFLSMVGEDTFYAHGRGDLTLGRATVLLDRLAAGGRPFFALIHFIDPHAPYRAPDPVYGTFGDGEEDGLLPAWRGSSDYILKLRAFPERFQPGDPHAEAVLEAYRRRYDEEVLFVDDCIGWLWARARAVAGDRPLWVIVTSDHGEEFLEHARMGHGNSLFEPLLRVPLVLWGMPPAMLEAPLHGSEDIPRFLARQLLGAAAEARLAAGSARLGDGWRIHGWSRHLAVRQGSWKLLLEAPVAGGEYAPTALYDLARDPGERRNLLAERPGEVARLAAGLQEALAATVPVPRSAAEDEPDLRTRQTLRSLGYVGGGQ